MQHPGIPAQNVTGGWPANELERVLSAAVGDPGATPRVVEVLRRSHVWLPLPGGPSQDGVTLDLPTTELAGQPFVPVFSSEEQFRLIAGNLPFAVAPVPELAEGMPLGVGIVINPEGAVGIPIPAAGVPELRGPDARGAVATRLGLRIPASHEDPLEFLVAAIGELAATPVVLTARRALVQVEADREKLYVGVELARYEPEDQEAATLALGRALGAVPLPWEVGIVLLDVVQDPLVDWMRTAVQPFFARA
jgi:hypothetical protein